MILSVDDLKDWHGCLMLDGAFDPLHAGHVAYLQLAVTAFPAYPVVVTVASDAQIREKGREPVFPADTRAQVIHAMKGVNHVHIKTQPTEHVLAALKPALYVKGKDWENRLPEEQLVACSLYGVQVAYLGPVTDSSSDALRRWSLTEAESGLDRLEAFMAGQTPASMPWQPVTDYSFEARKAIEGDHPRLIQEVFQPRLLLDVGCGYGHLLTLLADRGVNGVGLDVTSHHTAAHPWIVADIAGEPIDVSRWKPFHLVICREVLEHLTVSQIRVAVTNLFRLATKYVYITTRFTDRGVFDAATEFAVDPTHITCLSQPFLRALCVLNGGKRRRDLEEKLDWMKKGRCLVYETRP